MSEEWKIRIQVESWRKNVKCHNIKHLEAQVELTNINDHVDESCSSESTSKSWLQDQ